MRMSRRGNTFNERPKQTGNKPWQRRQRWDEKGVFKAQLSEEEAGGAAERSGHVKNKKRSAALT